MKKALYNNYKFIIGVCIIIAPFIMTIFFSLPCSDDFAMARDILPGGVHLLEIIKKTNEEYMKWMGLWPYFFIEYMLNPIYIFSHVSHSVGLFLIATFIGFIVLTYFYIKVICKYVLDIENTTIYKVVYFIFVFIFLNSELYSEIFYWFVGNVYLWNIMFMMGNQILVIKLFREDMTKRKYIFLCFVGFIACFAFQLAVFSGLIYLFECIKWIKADNKLNVKKIIPLLIMILGGCLSAFAPGNLVRSRGYSESLSLKWALLMGLQNENSYIIKAFKNPMFLIMLVVGFTIGYLSKKKSRYSIIESLVIMILSVFGLTFPVALGYSANTVPNRIEFMLNFMIYICSIVMAMQVGCVIRGFAGDIFQKSQILLYCVIASICIFTIEFQQTTPNSTKLDELPVVVTASNIETLAREFDYNTTILMQVYNAKPGAQITFDYNMFDESHILRGVGFESDEVIANMAKTWNKDDLTVICVPKK